MKINILKFKNIPHSVFDKMIIEVDIVEKYNKQRKHILYKLFNISHLIIINFFLSLKLEKLKNSKEIFTNGTVLIKIIITFRDCIYLKLGQNNMNMIQAKGKNTPI